MLKKKKKEACKKPAQQQMAERLAGEHCVAFSRVGT